MKKLIIITLCAILITCGIAQADTFRLGLERITYSPSASHTVTTDTTLTTAYDLVNVNATSSAITITLPSITSLTPMSKSYKILKSDSSTNAVTVTPATGDTIGGESTRVLLKQNDYMVISVGMNRNWVVDFESAYIKEDHEAGSVSLDALPTYTVGITLDDGVTDSPSLTFKDATDETAVFTKTDGSFLGLTTVAADGLNILTGNLKVGNGTPDVSQSTGESAYIEKTLEVDGAARFDGAVTTNSTVATNGAVTAASTITLDDGTTDSPALTLKDETNTTLAIVKVDNDYATMTTAATTGVQITTGNLKVGNGTAGTAAMDGEDAYVEGELEVDGAITLDGALTTNSTITAVGNVTLDDNTGASPNLTLTDGTNETAVLSKTDSGYLTVTTVAADGVQVVTGNLKVGAGTPDETINGEDLYVTGISEFDGTVNLDGTLTVGDAVTDSITLTAALQGVSPLILDGATDNTNELTITLGADPGADYTLTVPATSSAAVMISALTTNDVNVANSVWGVSNGLAFGGATGANGFELTVSPLTDPTADKTVSIPSLNNANVMISTLTTNDVDAANSVWGASNGIVFEGATGGADAFETTVTVTDPTADNTITLPNLSGTVAMIAGTGSNLTFTEKTGATALTTADCGTVITLNSGTEFQTTLPAATSGCWIRFIVKAAPSGANYTVVTNGSLNIIEGQVASAEDAAGSVSTTADSDTVNFVADKAIQGDYVDFISDGTNWYISGMCNVQDGITSAQVS